MVKRGSSTFSASAVVRSDLALGWRVKKTLANEAEASRLRHHVSVLSGWLHLSTLESESLRHQLHALRLVAPLCHSGDGKAFPLRKEVADVVAVHAPVAVPIASTVASLGALVETSLVTTVGFPFRVQEPEPDVAEPKLPVVQVERSPSVDWAVVICHRVVCVGWTMRLAWLLERLGLLGLLFPHHLLRFRLTISVPQRLRLLGREGPMVMVVILLLLPSAVVGVRRGVTGAIKIVLDFLCCVFVTDLLECGLGWGYGLACGSVW